MVGGRALNALVDLMISIPSSPFPFGRTVSVENPEPESVESICGAPNPPPIGSDCGIVDVDVDVACIDNDGAIMLGCKDELEEVDMDSGCIEVGAMFIEVLYCIICGEAILVSGGRLLLAIPISKSLGSLSGRTSRVRVCHT
jgi:hypothetical protein